MTDYYPGIVAVYMSDPDATVARTHRAIVEDDTTFEIVWIGPATSKGNAQADALEAIKALKRGEAPNVGELQREFRGPVEGGTE